MHRIIFTCLVCFHFAARVSADSCWGPATYPVVIWYSPIVVSPTLPVSPAIQSSSRPDPKIPQIAEPQRPASAKPPLIPPESESSPAKLPRDEKPFSVFVVQRSEGAMKEEGLRVKFFNHSERTLTLELEGKELKLAPGEFARRAIPREFSWKEKGGTANQQTIPPQSLGLDIVIRR